MSRIDTLDKLEALYGDAHPASLKKVMDRVVGVHARWIAASRFAMLATVGPEGVDASPRGDIGPVATLIDARTLAIPDWQGNNRLDSLRNIVRDGRVAVTFMVPGATSVVRVNGRATLSADDAHLSRFEVKGRHPTTVILISVEEVYMQCPKALLRSGLWGDTRPPEGLPTAGDLLSEGTSGTSGGPGFDADYATDAGPGMW